MIDVVLRRLGDKPQRKRHVTLRPVQAPDAANEYRFMEGLLCVDQDYCRRRYACPSGTEENLVNGWFTTLRFYFVKLRYILGNRLDN
jgi:hypothetical protein